MTLKYDNLVVFDHPLIQHKLSWLRDTTVSHRPFRALLYQIAGLMVYEITRSLPTSEIDVRTPLEVTKGRRLSAKITVVPVLRSGLGMAEGIVEMMPDPDGDGVESIVEKRYAMGRFSHENAVVMPDGKTVYHGDDGTDVVFFKFVADEAGDLSAGTLSAAKVTQNDDGSFGFEWIELGHGSDDEIAEAIRLMELP